MSFPLNNNTESEVRFYSRLFPNIFSKGKGSYMYSTEGERYLDFFCGSGSLNYGHNDPEMKEKLINYISQDGLVNSLDQSTEAKLKFMHDFKENILDVRGLNFKMQFCGPTGTNAIEAALKLARKYTKREKVVFFKKSFHGMTYGSMSVSGMKSSILHSDYDSQTVPMPYEDEEDNLRTFQRYLESCNAEHLPAAIILETVQAEGGMVAASKKWLEALNKLSKQFNILLIIDDIQAGCGRTGTFFSFEGISIDPDIICLSKSLSGIGLPFSMNLIKPAIDCWKPGEHNGTFRGNNLAFVTAAFASSCWKTDEFSQSVMDKSILIEQYFEDENLGEFCVLKGRGMMRGLQFANSDQTMLFQKELFKNNILVDTCGKENNVIKLMPPINISNDDLVYGLGIISRVLNVPA